MNDRGNAYLINLSGTYFVAHDLDDDILDFYSNSYLVDEVIADSLMSLCNKGYITKYSCSGHPFGNCEFEITYQKRDLAKFPNKICVASHPDDTSAYVICSLDRTYSSQMYISFKDNYSFEKFPKEWYWENDAIRKDIVAKDIIDFYKKQVESVELLNAWIDELPRNGVQ